MKKTYEIDGANIQSLDDFYNAVSTIIIPGADWGKNLDAFNDILHGGFGTPEEGFIIKWKNSALSQKNLGFPEKVKWLRKKLEKCHPDNREYVKKDIIEAENNKGQTLFEILVEIIQTHGAQGTESEDDVELELA